MPRDVRTREKLLADAQKEAIRARLEQGMQRITDDLDRTYDPEIGFSKYPANHGRVTVSEVLRRSGRVDKNTLKRPYHAAIRLSVLAFVARAQARCWAHVATNTKVEAANAGRKNASIDWYAQLLYAAEYRRDEAIAAARRLEAELSEKNSRVAQLEEEVANLRSALSADKVVRLR